MLLLKHSFEFRSAFLSFSAIATSVFAQLMSSFFSPVTLTLDGNPDIVKMNQHPGQTHRSLSSKTHVLFTHKHTHTSPITLPRPLKHASRNKRRVKVKVVRGPCGDAFPIEGVVVATYLLSVEALPHCRCGVANKSYMV